ncbi:TPA: hypothetical protein N0F65_012719 [Lagenidium giganteum]|uniref:Uncharacterized protein n=1 Tax=Lagenidium giganteum TaxID=4803 RepID=A0AAV2YID1_9STRA|nr:TPA: hypothetical protein N0F65_012719 [Lagenidium giganteum]
MDLSSAEAALRTLKFRPKVPQGAVTTAAALLEAVEPQKKQLVSLNGDPTSPDEDGAARDGIEQGLTTLLLYGKERWEPIAVVCVVVRDLLNLSLDHKTAQGLPGVEKEAPRAAFFTRAFLTEVMRTTAHDHLEHYEPRVRIAIAKLLGALAKWDLSWTYGEFVPQVVDSVLCNMSRSPDFEETGFEEQDDNVSINGMETPPQSPSVETPRTPSTPHRLDDVSGWKALESSLSAFKFIVEGCGSQWLAKQHDDTEKFEYMTPEIFELITTKSAFHINRHVRVVGFDTISALCDVATLGFLDAHREVTDVLCKCIVRGLQDNWSQVRYAASISARAFLVKLQENARADYLPVLVPRLCLNRYYIAERVQKHSQETWRLLMGERGREIVAQYATEVANYYVEMTNHCVREAACHCIAELASKVDAAAVRPHIPRLLEALIMCFHDNTWLVRDAACLATSQVVLHFPEECKPVLEELYVLWFDHLSDEIWSVREDAAIALGNVVRAYGEDALTRVVTFLDENLLLAKTQPAMCQHEYDELMKSEKKHMSKQAFSCCSLEPKCVERKENREKQPWEVSDGCIYMVRELCVVAPATATKFLPAVADVAILRHFPQTSVLQETIWKQVPHMCQALGKKEFKRYIELFFDPLVFTLQGTHRLAKFAASECVLQLSRQIRPTIFVGRLQANPDWATVLGAVLPAQM